MEVQQTYRAENDGQGEGDGDGADSQVQELEAMMLKMQSVKGILCPVFSLFVFRFPVSLVEFSVINQSRVFQSAATITFNFSFSPSKMTIYQSSAEFPQTEMSRDMPEAERRKFAARAVRGVLRGVSEV